MKFLTDRELNTIRGKVLVSRATPTEILSVFQHYDLLEMKLDDADDDDILGTQGWRYFIGLPEGN